MTVSLFCGYDAREAIGFHVFAASVIERASAPVAIHALHSMGMPEGSNAFTLSRFLVPWLMGYRGRAIYADACDMLMLDDLTKLDALFDHTKAVQVVQHAPYRTRHPIKYVGTSMQCPNVDYPRKNWCSLMLLNAAHPGWAGIDPKAVSGTAARALLQMSFLADVSIGALPDRWNRIVDEGQPVEGAALCHFTAGIPAFPHYAKTPGAELWRAQRDRMLEVA